MGGHHKLPMKELVGLLEGLDCRDVRTYILSGNAVFRTDRGMGPGLAAQVEKKLGVPTTSRNWNTVSRLIALADELARNE